MTTAYAIVRRPTEFAKSRIDTGPRDLNRAIYFYLNVFVLVFLIGSSLTYLEFYTGASQPRELAWLAIQIALAVPLLYLLNVIARQRVRFSGVAQGVLYADALFLVPLTLVGLLLSYLIFSQSSSQREIDILVTEFEQCLTRGSFLYWLVRGDLEFFMYLPKARSVEYLELAKNYFDYALAIPFCVLFGKLLNGRYAAPVLLYTILGVVAFALIVPTVTYGREKLRTAFAHGSHGSACVEEIARRGSEKYNASLLARQVAARINAELMRSTRTTDAPRVQLVEGRLVMALKRRPGKEDTAEARSNLVTDVTSIYCDRTTGVIFARALGMPLLLVVRDEAGSIVLREEINPGHCARGRSAR